MMTALIHPYFIPIMGMSIGGSIILFIGGKFGGPWGYVAARIGLLIGAAIGTNSLL